MRTTDTSGFTTEIFPGRSLPAEPFWPTFITFINRAFENADSSPVPKSALRLPPEPAQATEQFVEEIGPQGFMAVAFTTDAAGQKIPISCAGYQPFRDVSEYAAEAFAVKEAGGAAPTPASADVHEELPTRVTPTSWELCFVATAQSHRKLGLCDALLKVVEDDVRRMVQKERPGVGFRIYTRTLENPTGPFWRRKGFTTAEGAELILPKGYKFGRNEEGMKWDAVIWTGEKWFD